MRFLLVLFNVICVTGCGHKCPQCPPPASPQVVTLTKPCMTPLTDLIEVPQWPAPDKDGNVTLPQATVTATAQLLVQLRAYIRVQLDACKVPE